MMSVYSLINIPYGSMATMMTKDQYQRTLLNIFRQVVCTDCESSLLKKQQTKTGSTGCPISPNFSYK